MDPALLHLQPQAGRDTNGEFGLLLCRTKSTFFFRKLLY